MTSPPHDIDAELTARVIKALETVLETDLGDAGPDTRLFEELGLDSSRVLELLMTLEEDHGIAFDTERLTPEHLSTVGAVSALVAASVGE